MPLPVIEARHSIVALRIRLFAAAFAALVGALALFEWAVDVDRLIDILPGITAMSPVTAACLLLGSAALGLRPRRHRMTTSLLACLLLLVGAAKLTQFVLGLSWGGDGLRFVDQLGRLGTPTSTMTPSMGLALILLGGALLASGARHRILVLLSQSLSMLIIGIALFAVIGHILHLVALHEVSSFNAMPLQAALALLALASGIISINLDIGVMRIVCDKGPAGVLARTSLPFVLLVPVMVGILRLSGEKAGLYGTDPASRYRSLRTCWSRSDC